MSNGIGFLILLVAVAVILTLRWILWSCSKRLCNSTTLSQVPRYGRATAIYAMRLLRYVHPGVSTFLRERFGLHTFTGLPLTLFVLAAAYIAVLLAGLAHEVLEAEGTARFDEAVNAVFAPWRKQPVIAAFLWITELGSGPALGAVAMTATAFLWADRRGGLIVPLWMAFLGAQLTTWAGKFIIDRHRPAFIEGVSAISPSFPSGHATGAMAVYGFLAYAVMRNLPGARPRFEVVFWCGVLIVLVGFSRIYLSAHYLTDVAAGFLVGGFWLAVAFALAEWQRAWHAFPI